MEMEKKMYPITSKDISSLIGLILGISLSFFLFSTSCKKNNLLSRGELVHEGKYVVEGESPSDFLKRYTISANQVGKDNLVFFEPYGKLESIIESGDTLTLRFSDKQKKYLTKKSEVPIRYENIKDIN